LGLERDGLRLLEVSTRWLQVAAAHGLTLYEIGLALCRADDNPSAIETAISSAISTACVAARTPLLRTSTSPHHGPSKVAGGAGVGIFDLPLAEFGMELEWTARLEDPFSRHVGDALELLVCSRSPLVVPPALSVKRTIEKEGAPPDVPSELVVLPKRSAKGYVPPRVRRLLEAERAATCAEGETVIAASLQA
jgi:hypothetical protein